MDRLERFYKIDQLLKERKGPGRTSASSPRRSSSAHAHHRVAHEAYLVFGERLADRLPHRRTVALLEVKVALARAVGRQVGRLFTASTSGMPLAPSMESV
jgi:hypothetical protein